MTDLQEYTIKNEGSSGLETLFAFKLTEELVDKIVAGQKDLDRLSGVEFIMSGDGHGIDRLVIRGTHAHTNTNTNTHTIQLMRIKETQPVHLVDFNSKTRSMNIVGTIAHKLNPKLELEASKAESIRQRSQEAEKERTARKTVELDSLPVSLRGTKLVKRNVGVPVSGSSVGFSASGTSAMQFPLRTRVIQLLAIGPLSRESVASKLGVSQAGIAAQLSELASLQAGAYHLRPELHREVKIADWPFYSMRERGIVSSNMSAMAGASAFPANDSPVPRTPSPKRMTHNGMAPASASISVSAPRSVSSSAKKTTSVKDRLTAIMNKRPASVKKR